MPHPSPNKARPASLLDLHPDVAKEWHPTKNGDLTPADVSAGSGKKVWWMCPRGHELQTIVRDRVRGKGCAGCNGRALLPGENDLETLNPEVAAEWHPIKNGSVTARAVRAASTKRAWWRCGDGHEWETSPYARTGPKRTGCPYCAGNLAIPGKTDMATLHPEVAAEWHPTRNGDRKPAEFTAKSGKKMWWLCKNGHSWPARINNRTRGIGCPHCLKERHAATKAARDKKRSDTPAYLPAPEGGRVLRAQPGNSLADRFPHLIPWWHPTKNGSVKIDEVRPSSNAQFWWQCEHGHDWLATPTVRVKAKGCHFCDGTSLTLQKGYSDLASQKPELAAEWHPELNGDLAPEEIRANATTKVWWTCDHEHAYQTSPANRGRGGGCPYCQNKKLLSGFNDLATTHPHLVDEWDYDRNSDTPEDVIAGSHKKRFWLCGSGHSWEAPLKARAYNETGCPVCVNATLLVGFNDAATTHPHLVADWDVAANGALSPQDLMAFSSTRVAWKCAKCGWQWETKIAHRASGSGCPGCSPLLHTSGSETRLRDWLSQSGVLVDVVQDKNARLEIPWRTRTWMQVDVLGELAGTGRQVVVEYDGIQWHNNDDSFLRDRDKTVALLGAGILVVRVRENDLGFIDLEDPGLLQLNCEWSYDDGPTVEAASVIEAWLWSQLPADHPLRVGGAAA